MIDSSDFVGVDDKILILSMSFAKIIIILVFLNKRHR